MAPNEKVSARPQWGWIAAVILSALVAIILVLLAHLGEKSGVDSLLTGVVEAVGIGLLTSSILGGFAEFALRKQMLTDFSKETSGILNRFFDQTFRSSQKYGFVGIRDELEIPQFFRLARDGETISWLDTYDPGHRSWLDLVEERAQSGINFRFLVLEPASEIARLRRTEIGGRFEEWFETELDIFRRDLTALASRCKGHTRGTIEVRIYDDLLANPFYLIHDGNRPLHAISSYYLRRATGVSFPHFEWRGGPEAFVHALKSYFDWKWERALPVPLASADTIGQPEEGAQN